jgi:hypothetical protein
MAPGEKMRHSTMPLSDVNEPLMAYGKISLQSSPAENALPGGNPAGDCLAGESYGNDD